MNRLYALGSRLVFSFFSGFSFLAFSFFATGFFVLGFFLMTGAAAAQK
jgi:hypothetical protein